MQNTFDLKTTASSVNWKNVGIITSFHLFAIPLFFTFSWPNLAVLLIVNWIVGSLGVGLGWHRLLTHRSFKAPWWIEYTLTILGTMSMQDPPDKWVATHPHSSRVCRDRQGSALDAARVFVGADRLDRLGNGAGPRCCDDEKICSRPVEGQMASADLELLLCADHHFGICPVRFRRMDDGRMGCFWTGSCGMAYDVVRQFALAPLRQTSARYRRPIDE